VFIATLIVSVLLVGGLLGSAAGKVTKQAAVMTNMKAVGVPEKRVPLLAIPETVGALGLVGGLFWWPIGVAAAIGIIIYFVLAVSAHVRVHDKNFAPAAFLLVLAIAALVLRIATH
jgi:hypothetical protein